MKIYSMATVCINTSAEEQQRVYDFIRTLSGEQISISEIARAIGMPQSRTRYALDDLVSDNRVEKIPVRQFNRNYVRYTYKAIG